MAASVYSVENVVSIKRCRMLRFSMAIRTDLWLVCVQCEVFMQSDVDQGVSPLAGHPAGQVCPERGLSGRVLGASRFGGRRLGCQPLRAVGKVGDTGELIITVVRFARLVGFC